MTVKLLTAQKRNTTIKGYVTEADQARQAWQAIRGLWKGRKVHAVKYQRAIRRAADR